MSIFTLRVTELNSITKTGAKDNRLYSAMVGRCPGLKSDIAEFRKVPCPDPVERSYEVSMATPKHTEVITVLIEVCHRSILVGKLG
jgi:hypothetical protein